MPLFMVKKEVFEWIINKQKTIELRKGKAKKGEEAVFQCGRRIVMRITSLWKFVLLHSFHYIVFMNKIVYIRQKERFSL